MDFDAKRQVGTFNGDVLEAGLGNKEHSGRTRGVGVVAPWKTGRNWTKDDKRQFKKARKELYEKNLRDNIKAEIVAELSAMYPSLQLTMPSPGPRPSSCTASQEVTPTTDTDTINPCDTIEVINCTYAYIS